ncbi:DUF4381 domain-containing protein [uncultured Photobacterium sp.]|uniref:DUF4381 domain-containing protein n=1 Tax=uncultured Photobacterium sp. TaxID=173973 RepID=UPI00260E16AC|nr:DUF4381 domain-containing protein [uncultured Photobacterium sp.]
MANPITATDLAASLPLADVHLPNIPGYWPLTWGWWLCIAAILIVISVAFFLIRKHLMKQRARKEALQQLKHFNNPEQLGNINLLLRQTAMSYYPRQQVASLTGEQWLSFLDQHLSNKHQGFISLSSYWQRGLFSPQGLELNEFRKCYKQAAIWLKKAQFPSSSNQIMEASDV